MKARNVLNSLTKIKFDTVKKIIISKVGNEMNRLIRKFKERNPKFNGKISLIGHSLGSVICFDLLSHQVENGHFDESLNSDVQKNAAETVSNTNFEETETLETFLTRINLTEYKSLFEKEKITMKNMVSFWQIN